MQEVLDGRAPFSVRGSVGPDWAPVLVLCAADLGPLTPAQPRGSRRSDLGSDPVPAGAHVPWISAARAAPDPRFRGSAVERGRRRAGRRPPSPAVDCRALLKRSKAPPFAVGGPDPPRAARRERVTAPDICFRPGCAQGSAHRSPRRVVVASPSRPLSRSAPALSRAPGSRVRGPGLAGLLRNRRVGVLRRKLRGEAPKQRPGVEARGRGPERRATRAGAPAVPSGSTRGSCAAAFRSGPPRIQSLALRLYLCSYVFVREGLQLFLVGYFMFHGAGGVQSRLEDDGSPGLRLQACDSKGRSLPWTRRARAEGGSALPTEEDGEEGRRGVEGSHTCAFVMHLSG